MSAPLPRSLSRPAAHVRRPLEHTGLRFTLGHSARAEGADWTLAPVPGVIGLRAHVLAPALVSERRGRFRGKNQPFISGSDGGEWAAALRSRPPPPSASLHHRGGALGVALHFIRGSIRSIRSHQGTSIIAVCSLKPSFWPKEAILQIFVIEPINHETTSLSHWQVCFVSSGALKQRC